LPYVEADRAPQESFEKLGRRLIRPFTFGKHAQTENAAQSSIVTCCPSNSPENFAAAEVKILDRSRVECGEWRRPGHGWRNDSRWRRVGGEPQNLVESLKQVFSSGC